MSLAKKIRNTPVGSNELDIYWLGQAGFAFKTPWDTVLYLDPYLSHSVEKFHGFRRLMPPLFSPAEADADVVVLTHEHEDHVDSETVAAMATRISTIFVGPPTALNKCQTLGVRKNMLVELREDAIKSIKGIILTGIHADHGNLSPDAIGVLMDFGFVRVYITGDTAYRPEKIRRVINTKPEIIIPVINGAYGNLNEQEAALLTRDVKANVAIPCHFGMFAEHGGDPEKFASLCRNTAPQSRVEMIPYGEVYRFKKYDAGNVFKSG